MKNKLSKYLKKNKHVKLFSNIKDDDTVYFGYIVGLSDTFVCLLTTDDFRQDGFVIMPISVIKRVRHSKYEKTYQKIMKEEKRLNGIKKPKWLKLKSYKSIFKSLAKNYNNVIIESRYPRYDEFRIGKIKKIKNKKLLMRDFDAKGKWGKGNIHIPFKSITDIKFKDEYSTVFRKYVK